MAHPLPPRAAMILAWSHPLLRAASAGHRGWSALSQAYLL